MGHPSRRVWCTTYRWTWLERTTIPFSHAAPNSADAFKLHSDLHSTAVSIGRSGFSIDGLPRHGFVLEAPSILHTGSAHVPTLQTRDPLALNGTS